MKKPHARALALSDTAGASARFPNRREARPRSMRSTLSFPRAIHVPSPRILFYACDLPGPVQRDLALARALTAEFATGNVVLATGALEAARAPCGPRIEVVKVPSFGAESPPRPLAHERVRILQRRLLASLFDSFLPDVVLLDLAGPEARGEARELLVRVTALEAAHLVVDNPHAAGDACRSAGSDGLDDACESCIHRIRAAARHAYARLEERRRPHGPRP